MPNSIGKIQGIISTAERKKMEPNQQVIKTLADQLTADERPLSEINKFFQRALTPNGNLAAMLTDDLVASHDALVAKYSALGAPPTAGRGWQATAVNILA